MSEVATAVGRSLGVNYGLKVSMSEVAGKGRLPLVASLMLTGWCRTVLDNAFY